jgi:hypothetical protein
MSIPNKKMKIWSALFQVRAKEGNNIFKGKSNAFVPTLALAENEKDAVSLISKKLDSYDLEVIHFEDFEVFDIGQSRASQEMLDLAKSLTYDKPVGFGGFHSYPEQDGNQRHENRQ